MKISIIGLGKVGSSLAFVLSQRNIAKELMLVGRRKESVMGDVLDLRHGQLFVDAPTRITAGELADTANSDIIAICASVPTTPDMTDRLQQAPANVALLKAMFPILSDASPNAKIVMVSNPVDVLVHFALEFSGFAPHQIMGTGTLVDSARFRQLLADEIHIHMEDIRAYILGEHGDSQFPAMSCADAGGEPIDDTPHRRELFKRASNAGFEVFKYKGYTNYAIALAAADIIQSIASDTKNTMPISLKVNGFLGVDDVCLSLPAVVGARGVERVLHPKLDDKEKQEFLHSAGVIREVINQVNAGLP
ncbi:putative L-lactate dehydrogenase [Teredinibacter turnerae T7901]|uniref:L-lactate dehydrogenase n=1 Tax=Teredinibacter turnerae (strain ATCC 39867 / T7901) TaxID=377629 RepID=C5BM91_TERTT|nr:lactate dehydrogenase [Teredinibacter turnerae]ACR13927.1 putative L-lactate dehydrogenase [Teredinibacter turnerae T7901]